MCYKYCKASLRLCPWDFARPQPVARYYRLSCSILWSYDFEVGLCMLSRESPKTLRWLTCNPKDHDFVNVPIFLHTISSLPQDLLLKTADIILSGLSICTRDPGPLRSEMMTSPDFWVILRVVAGDANAAAQIFDILERSTTGTPPAIMADNYEAAISLLNHFASAADPLSSRDSKAHESTKKDA